MPTESQQPRTLRASVIDRFRRVAIAPDQERKFPVGPESAKKLGYEPAEVDAFPSAVTESFCGVGNPFSLGQPLPGQTVLDLGCGAGFDTLLAAKRVGPNGKVIGMDMTPEMIAKARTQRLPARRDERRVHPGGDRVTALARRFGRSGDLQRRLQPLPGQAEGAERGLPGLEAWRSAPDGRHPPGATCHARGGGKQGLLVGLNRRCSVGAVAPGDAG